MTDRDITSAPEREVRQAELLDAYWASLAKDPETVAPAGLDPESARLVRRLEAGLRPPEPLPAFKASLRRDLEARAASQAAWQGEWAPVARPRLADRVRILPRLPGRRALAAGLVAALLALTLVGALLLPSKAPSVSAEEIVERARVATTSLEAPGVRGFELVQVVTTLAQTSPAARNQAQPAGGVVRSETHVWHVAPNKWRFEQRPVPASGDPGTVPDSPPRVTVADGQDVWSYDPAQNLVQVTAGKLDGSAMGDFSIGGSADLATVLGQARTCFAPRVTGREQVAGRAAYVVSLGATKCPSASAGAPNGPQTVWIDEETFFVLKRVIRAADGGPVVFSAEVTSLRYNPDLDDGLFAFAPPAGAAVQDSRPRPAPSADEYREQLARLAAQADFPVFAPRDVPAGLVPRAPRLDPALGLQLAYVPSGEAGADSPAGSAGLSIVQRRATYEAVAAWTRGAERVAVGAGEGWLRRGGQGVDSAAIVVRDGTLISVASFSVAPDELVRVAGSFEAVPGGHAPLPEPTPPTLAQVRARSPYPIFVPTDVPAGLAPEPPVDGRIDYHDATGAVVLSVQNGPAGSGLGADPRKGGEEVMLRDGVTAHYLPNPPELGGPILWWEQEGTSVALSGPHLTREDLVRTASSVSKTADPGRAALAAARPTPTPLPEDPGFRVLRPTWLPEPVTVREERRPAGGEVGTEVVLTFDPRPNDRPHDVVTLTERAAKAQSRDEQPDPQATREVIGGREVTVIRRGEGCVSFLWEQDGVSLALTNAYDPPGAPGEVRYPCDQMRRLIESVR